MNEVLLMDEAACDKVLSAAREQYRCRRIGLMLRGINRKKRARMEA